MGAINFTETLHDSKTIPEALEQYERLNGEQPKEVFVDRGYRGIKEYNGAKINSPKPEKNISNQKVQGHIQRAGIEPVIGHLKQSYRLSRNYLKGILGDNMNVILAAAAMNFKRRMNLWRTEANLRWVLLFKYIQGVYWDFYALSKSDFLRVNYIEPILIVLGFTKAPFHQLIILLNIPIRLLKQLFFLMQLIF